MNYPHPLIAREGWPFLAGAFLISLLVHASAGFWWALPLWIITLFVLQFFRDPPRPIRATECRAAPADGRIVSVEKVQDPYASAKR